jgi:hypothetical protein
MDMETIADKDFKQLITKRAQTLLSLANHLSRSRTSDKILVRPLLGQLLSQSTQLEELLDAYDAGSNCRWCLFRSLTAAIKLFADVSYELLHIRHTLPLYRLLPIEQDFVKATEQSLRFTGDVLLRTANQILDKADKLGLSIPQKKSGQQSYAEHLPAGRLVRDCNRRRTETISETVTLLATAFLNLAADTDHIHAAMRARPEEYSSYIADSLSEEKLRSLELRFHNLQSQYDTYVLGREAESLDVDLPVLRGHISVVFHLLKTATLFAHYYERHVSKPTCDILAHQAPLVSSEALLAILMDYSIAFISYYIVSAKHLCQRMLKRYMEVGRIEAPIPQYRGFHVRPSTLISKIVLHYGSGVRMELEDESYDAGAALELFRANEKINARKRRWLAEEIARLKLVPEQADDRDIGVIVREVILALTERSKLILYEQPLQLPDEHEQKQREGTLLEQVIDEIARLQATGKIDTDIDLNVMFVGDKRILADIKLLAEAGYGEDNFGNNIALPQELTYLRR